MQSPASTPPAPSLVSNPWWAYLSCAVALAAIASQWWENHQLREALRNATPTSFQGTLTGTEIVTVRKALGTWESDRQKLNAYAKAQNTWIEEANAMVSKVYDTVGEKIAAAETSAQQAVWQRNAQSLVAVCMAGDAAGVEWQGVSRDEIVRDVLKGRAPTGGAFMGKEFRVPSSWAEMTLALPYIKAEADRPGTLMYDRTGSQPSAPGASVPATSSKSTFPKWPAIPKVPEF